MNDLLTLAGILQGGVVAPWWAVLMVALIGGLGGPLSAYLVGRMQRRTAVEASAALLKVANDARLAAENAGTAATSADAHAEAAAVKAEEVKKALAATGAETASHLHAIETQGNKTYELVNNQFSEKLKQNQVLAHMLLALKPDDPVIRRLAEAADAEVKAHRPAESTIAEERLQTEHDG